MYRTCVVVAVAVWMACGWVSAPLAGQASASVVILGARVVDGSGAAPVIANVRIRGDAIAAVGPFEPVAGDTIVRGEGLALAPGFVDVHNHSATGLADDDPLATTQVSQGITTALLGPDGSSPWPVGAYLEARRARAPALNVAMTVGHATIRRQVMGDDFRREATPAEVERMRVLVAQAMREGAVGLSSGLEYEVGGYASTDEVVALAEVAGQHGGFYISHIRDEADRAFEAMRELVTIAERAKLPVQNTHLKLGTVGVWGKANDTVRLFEDARRRGLDVTADAYPYDAWHSTITVLVPNKRYDDRASVERGLADVGGAQNVTITECDAHRDYEGRTLEAIAKDKQTTAADVFMEVVRDGGAGVIAKSMVDEDIRTLYAQPWVMVASDGGIGMKHPRAAGTFPRVLGRFVRDWKWLTLEEAVRKMTSLPAKRLSLTDRGLVREGYKADLVLFNPTTVIDRSTFTDPAAIAVGIEKVWVNGALVWSEGRTTGARPGRVLARTASSAQRP